MDTKYFNIEEEDFLAIMKDIQDNCKLRFTYDIACEILRAYKRPGILNKVSKTKEAPLKKIEINIQDLNDLPF